MTRFNRDARVGVLYEHPLWFEPLFDELARRGIPFERIDAARLSYDPAVTSLPYGVVVNRMSASATERDRQSGHHVYLRRSEPNDTDTNPIDHD